MTKNTLSVQEIIEKAVPIFKKRPEIKRVELFGSMSKGIQNEDSDIDFLVDIAKDAANFTIMDIVKLILELEKTFNRRVDIVDRTTIESPKLQKSIIEAPTNILLLSCNTCHS